MFVGQLVAGGRVVDGLVCFFECLSGVVVHVLMDGVDEVLDLGWCLGEHVGGGADGVLDRLRGMLEVRRDESSARPQTLSASGRVLTYPHLDFLINKK